MYVYHLYASHTIDHDVPTGPNGSHVNCIEPVTLMHATHTGWQKLFKYAAKNQGFQIGTLFREKRRFVGHIGCDQHTTCAMNILYPSMLHLKLCFATIRSTCVQRKSQPHYHGRQVARFVKENA